MSLEAIRYARGQLTVLDQLRLPQVSEYVEVKDVKDAWKVINAMQVRGAPAIAIVACLSLAVELADNRRVTDDDKTTLRDEIATKLKYLVSARPTAVNVKLAADDLNSKSDVLCSNATISATEMKEAIITDIESMLQKDISDNKSIGKFGAEAILNVHHNSNVNILTHCNTGSLATAGYGTALGVVRRLFELNKLDHCYFSETRPYNQGARLTAYELIYEKIPSTLVVDSAVAYLMKNKTISAVVVGADRIAANGDTANKIGTYQIAVVAQHHSVPFYIAAPFTSIDFSIPSGGHIKIEERPEKEMTHVGSQRIAAEGVITWNPAFDVTPASLITGIITEKGVYPPDKLPRN